MGVIAPVARPNRGYAQLGLACDRACRSRVLRLLLGTRPSRFETRSRSPYPAGGAPLAGPCASTGSRGVPVERGSARAPPRSRSSTTSLRVASRRFASPRFFLLARSPSPTTRPRSTFPRVFKVRDEPSHWPLCADVSGRCYAPPPLGSIPERVCADAVGHSQGESAPCPNLSYSCSTKQVMESSTEK